MKKTCSLLFVCALAAATGVAAEPDPRLAPLLPLVGKTWRGTLSAPGAAKAIVDVHRFDLAVGGRAVRSSHSVNDGEYGGETLFTWDEEKKTIVYTYVTNGGFYTTGTLAVEAGGGFKSLETVHGSAGGVSQVEATSQVLPDGRLHVKSRHLKDGQWVEGREVYYAVDASAVVRFKD